MLSELSEILQFANLGGIVNVVITLIAIISIFVEFTPIKWNPISSLFKWIGNKINGEVLTKVNSLQSQINNIKGESDERNAIECRVRILRFGDELRLGIQHSQESFDQIMDDMNLYDKYCKDHPEFINNRTVLTKKKILEVYWSSMDNNNFL